MDIRAPVLAILVGGAPAPGINGVISAVGLEALNSHCSVIGFKQGFKHLKKGLSTYVHRFNYEDVTKLHSEGGSFICTSRETLDTPQDVDNVLRVLDMLRVRYLVTIGGTVTASSVYKVVTAARKAGMDLSVVHVPKTIFNDLPLPPNSYTFGFSTAVETGVTIVHNLKSDARTMLRWYIIVVMGQKAGHLSLNIGKAAAATLTIIPEEYTNRTVKISALCDQIEASIYKRKVSDKDYGVAILTEGLVDLMDPAEVKAMFGTVDDGHQELGRHIAVELKRRFQERGQVMTFVARNMGNELRAADPNAMDMTLARDLGYGATRKLLDGAGGCMLTLKDGSINPIALSDIVDPKTGSTQIRTVDIKGLSYEVALKYMIRLKKTDLADFGMLNRLAKVAHMTSEEFSSRFAAIADDQ